MGKYGNTKCAANGITFDSKAERKRYLELQLLQQAGSIKDVHFHKRWTLQPSFKLAGKTIQAITYESDFAYFDNELNKYVVEDVKGKTAPLTEVFKIKAKMLAYTTGHVVTIVRR